MDTPEVIDIDWSVWVFFILYYFFWALTDPHHFKVACSCILLNGIAIILLIIAD